MRGLYCLAYNIVFFFFLEKLMYSFIDRLARQYLIQFFECYVAALLLVLNRHFALAIVARVFCDLHLKSEL